MTCTEWGATSRHPQGTGHRVRARHPLLARPPFAPCANRGVQGGLRRRVPAYPGAPPSRAQAQPRRDSGLPAPPRTAPTPSPGASSCATHLSHAPSLLRNMQGGQQDPYAQGCGIPTLPSARPACAQKGQPPPAQTMPPRAGPPAPSRLHQRVPLHVQGVCSMGRVLWRQRRCREGQGG